MQEIWKMNSYQFHLSTTPVWLMDEVSVSLHFCAVIIILYPYNRKQAILPHMTYSSLIY